MPTFVWLLPALGLTLAWIAPLHLLPWLSWHGEIPVFAALFVTASWAAVLHMIACGRAARVPVPTLVVALLCLALVSVLQAAAGQVRYWGDAWVVCLYAALCVAAFLLGHAATRAEAANAKHAEALAATLLVAGAGCTFIALVQALEIWPALEWIARTDLRRPGSNLAQPNQMATLVLMGMVGLVYLFERRRLGAAVATILALVLCTGLVTTESRTALLSLAALAVWWWWFRRSDSRLARAAVAAAVAIVLVGYAAWPRALMSFHGMDEDALAAAQVSTQVGARAIVWPQLLEAVSQRPLAGWGLRQTPMALTSVLDAQPRSEPFPYAHNIVLDALLGFGAPLTIVFLGLTALWIWRRRGAARELTGWFGLALCIPFAVHALLEFPHTYAYLLAPVLFALGMVDAMSGPPARIRIPAPWAAAALAGVGALGAWSVVEYVSIEEDFRVARFEAGRIGFTPADYERPQVHVLTQLGALLEGARVVPKRQMPPGQIQLARDVAYRFPWPALQNRYALALALNGDPVEGHRMLRVIRAMHGEVLYSEIRTNWQVLAADKYPELLNSPLP